MAMSLLKTAVLLLVALAAAYVFFTEQNIFVCFASAIVAGAAMTEMIKNSLAST